MIHPSCWFIQADHSLSGKNYQQKPSLIDWFLEGFSTSWVLTRKDHSRYHTSISQRAAITWPAEAAWWRGLHPQASTTLRSTPTPISKSRQATLPPAAASCMGWLPPLSVAVGFPPAANKIRSTSLWPWRAAVCKLPQNECSLNYV